MHKYIHNVTKSCARYTLGARYMYFKSNAEKFGERVIRKVRAIGRKIRYFETFESETFVPVL
jgi:hypothetical protein